MGFRDLIDRGSLSASFMSVTVYEARGISLPNGFASARQSRVAGADYRIALSSSINIGCQFLVGNDFTESEIEWQKEVHASGPFVLIAIGPTDFIECEAGRMMPMPDGSISTYDCFPGVRETLTSLEERVLPPVVATITLALNEPSRYVSLRKLSQSSVGRTPQGNTIHDIRHEFRGEFTTSHLLPAERAVEVLNASIERAPRLHQRAATYFALGGAETDQLKKFLYFFLSLEVETHAIFGRIDHIEEFHAKILSDRTESLRPSTVDLITRGIAKWDNLFDRFVWCAACAWPTLADDDIKLFKELKSVRDGIAHGRISAPPAGSARKAELLAHKILWA